jgi:cell division protein FtsB
MRRATKTWLGRGAAAVLVAGVLSYVPYHVYARSGLARTLQLRRELALLKTRNAQLKDETDRLARQAEALRDDPDAIERVARSELGWVRPGEIILDLSRSADEGDRAGHRASDHPGTSARGRGRP